ncbi:MAG: pyridoxamine 5'-phosphate oxidase family protein, partial [Flavobacteriia bacterium]
MGTQLQEINSEIAKFINNQKIFFVATATKDSFINLSPKG